MSYCLRLTQTYGTPISGVWRQEIPPKSATSDITVFKVRREIVCRFQEHHDLSSRDRVVLGAILGLFMGLCVDLRRAFWIAHAIGLGGVDRFRNSSRVSL